MGASVSSGIIKQRMTIELRSAGAAYCLLVNVTRELRGWAGLSLHICSNLVALKYPREPFMESTRALPFAS